jgi:hypothetical protein
MQRNANGDKRWDNVFVFFTQALCTAVVNLCRTEHVQSFVRTIMVILDQNASAAPGYWQLPPSARGASARVSRFMMNSAIDDHSARTRPATELQHSFAVLPSS